MTKPRRTDDAAQAGSAAPVEPRLAPVEPRLAPVDAPAWGPRAGIARGLEPRTLAGQTAQRLREDIIRNRFQPGERLTLEKLASRYQVGTSPLREALFQVTGDGLVRVEDHKGFVVAPLDRGEMLDVSSLRAHLESHALQRSIEQGGEDWETAVLTAAHRLGKAASRLARARGAGLPDAQDEWEQRHRAFHHALCSGCGSPWLLHFFDALHDPLERYRRHLWRHEERIRDAGGEHDEIKDAALARDAKKAVRLLGAHFDRQAVLMAALPWSDGKSPQIPAGAVSKAAAVGRERGPRVRAKKAASSRT